MGHNADRVIVTGMTPGLWCVYMQTAVGRCQASLSLSWRPLFKLAAQVVPPFPSWHSRRANPQPGPVGASIFGFNALIHFSVHHMASSLALVVTFITPTLAGSKRSAAP